MGLQPLDRVPRGAERREWQEAARDYIFENTVPITPVILVAVLIVLALLYWRLRGWLQRRRAMRDMIRQVLDRCEDRGLTAQEEAGLIRALSRTDLVEPETVVESEEYFDTFLAPQLTRELDGAVAERIREKLFDRPRSAPASTPVVPVAPDRPPPSEA
jgi:hypothetical protein